MKTVLNSGLPSPSAVRIQCDAIAALAAAPALAFTFPAMKSLGRGSVPGLLLSTTRVAVGQSVEGARVLEPCRERLHLEACGSGRYLAGLPIDCLRNAHGRHQVLVRFGQIRVRAILPGGVAAF